MQVKTRYTPEKREEWTILEGAVNDCKST